MKKRNLILVRHGQSEWNAKNLFTGWKNPGLTELGLKEASGAAELIANQDISFDLMFTSELSRAQKTGSIILEAINQTFLTKMYAVSTLLTINVIIV